MANNPGLFGQTPDAIRMAMANERLGRASLIGGLGPGGHGALAGDMLGHGVMGALGAGDPRLRQAQELQNIEQQISQMGLEPGTPEFTRNTVALVRSRLGEQAAIQAWQMAAQLEQQRAELNTIRNGPAAEQFQTEQRAQALVARGGDPNTALIVAADKELWRERMKELSSVDKGTADMQNFKMAQQDPAFAAWLTQQKRAGATTVKVENFYSKPLGTDAAKWRNPDGTPADPNQTASEAAAAGARPVTAEEQAALTKTAQLEAANTSENKEVLSAVGQLRSITQGLSVGSFVSPTDRGRFRNARARLAKAIAQKRNPGDAEASAQAEERLLEALPDLTTAIAVPGSIEAVVRDFEAEAGGAVDDGAGSVKARADELIRELGGR